MPQILLTGSSKLLKCKPGDCVIFDQRLLHAGGHVRGKSSKYSLFMGYGLRNSHSFRHRNFYLSRPTYMKTIPGDLTVLLKDKNLWLGQPS